MRDIESSLIETASFLPVSVEHPNAWVGHLPFAAWLIQQIKPDVFVELGTHSGNSYFAFCQAVDDESLSTKCYAVDTWSGEEHAGFYDETIFHKVNAHNQKHYEKFSRLMRMTFDQANDYFTGGSIDLLHIDGLHTYEAVKHDFETWLPKLTPGAVVLFHDINVRERDFGVWKFWEELKEHYPNNLEFLHSHGLGVLQISENEAEGYEWLNSSSSLQQSLRDYFAALGARQSERFERDILKNDVQTINAALVEKDNHIAGFNQALEEKDNHIAGLNQALEEKDNHIAGLNQALEEKDNHIAGLNQALEEKDNHIVGLKQAIFERDEQFSKILNSRSWRLTSPLRYVVIKGRKVRTFQALLRRRLQVEPFPALLKKILSVIRREGFSGLKLRIHQQQLLLAKTTTTPINISPSIANLPETATIACDSNGEYALVFSTKGYTYIEPQRPIDLDPRIHALPSRPFFSIVVPVYNTTAELLGKALDSVIAQWYSNWEMILVNDASPSTETHAALEMIGHSQVKVLHLPFNKGISGATNAGLDVARGDFIVFMDHDDELTVDCLYELALCINREDPDFIYSDEDKIAENGAYIEPHFKPDWSPDTMMSTMYSCHVSCVRRSLLEIVGGLRSEFDGCQDWDFVLRITEHTTRISHIPKVLYHWRIIPASIAYDIGAKPYVLEASRRVRQAALDRRGFPGKVEALPQMKGYFRVAYELNDEPLISIIIPTRDNANVLRRCVDSILGRTHYRNFELVIIDNGSVDAIAISLFEELAERDDITVIHHDAPFNFSELNNLGVKFANGELLLFLNDDTEVLQEDWLERLGGFAQLPHVGAVGAKLLYPGQIKIQHAGILNLEDGPGHAFLQQHCDYPGYFMRNLLEYNWLAVTGACLMVKRSKFEQVGGFSESLSVAYNDVDICMRLRDASYYNVVVQAVRLVHHESASRGIDNLDPIKMTRLKHERALLYKRNPTYFQHDPFYSPNLHPNGSNFEVPA